MEAEETKGSGEWRRIGGTEHSWCRAVPGGTGITVAVLLLSPRLATVEIRDALRRLLASHPILRARIAGDDQAQPPQQYSSLSVDPAPADNSDPLLESLDPPPGSSLHSLLELELNRNPWAEAGHAPAPVFFPTIYEGGSSGTRVLALRFHTGFCDRTTAASVLRELMALLTASGDGGFAGRSPDRLNPAIEDLVPKQEAWKPFWARGKDLLGYSLNGFRTSLLPFVDASSTRSAEVVRVVMSEDDTGKLLSVCQERGIKLSAALVAAGLLATIISKNLEKDQHESYAVATLVDCRMYLEQALHDHNFGFYHSAILNTIDVHAGQGLWEVAARYRDALAGAFSSRKHFTDMGDLNYLLCKAIENPQLTPFASLRTALISVFEETVIDEASDDGDRRRQLIGAEDYVGCASLHGVGPSVGVFDVVRGGRLDCCFVYPAPLHSRKQVQELVDYMFELLVDGSQSQVGFDDN